MFSGIHFRVNNTFLDFHYSDGFDDNVVATRAHSADCIRNRDVSMSRTGKELHVWSYDKLLPLVGMADGAKSPIATETSQASANEVDQPDSPNVEELLLLYQRLSEVCLHRSGGAQSPKRRTQALVLTRITSSSSIRILSEEETIEGSSNALLKFQHRRASSGCSTCSLADSSDLMDEGESWKGLHRICSSNSVSTLNSDWPAHALASAEGIGGVSVQALDPPVVKSALNSSAWSAPCGGSSTHIPVAQPFLPLDGWINLMGPPQDVLRPYTAVTSPKASEKKRRNVPKRVDLSMENRRSAAESAPTTLMIRNIPKSYTTKVLMNEIDELGAQGKYNFVHMPFDFVSMSNVGYAFVNFPNVFDAKQCTDALTNYRFKTQSGSSTKTAVVSAAYLQGLEANLAHYEKCGVTSSRLTKSRPVVLAVASETRTQYPFDKATANGR